MVKYVQKLLTNYFIIPRGGLPKPIPTQEDEEQQDGADEELPDAEPHPTRRVDHMFAARGGPVMLSCH